MNLLLHGKNAVVTGASRGLGRAIAAELAAEGATVTAVARNAARLAELAVAAPAGAVTAIACDLSMASAIEALREPLARADILVLNTGGPPPGLAADVTDAIWLAQFESMFLSAVRLTRLALPGMRARRFGRIIVVASSGVIVPIANLAISNAVRAAVVSWAKTLASEVAADGVTVNCLAPGRLATDRVAELDQGRAARESLTLDEVERQARGQIPAGRYGVPEEFAAIATFLASPRSAYMTGGILRVDGGMIRNI